MEGLQDYNSEYKLGYSEKQLKLLSSSGLWGTDTVDKAFDLNPSSDDYSQQVDMLQNEAKKIFKGE